MKLTGLLLGAGASYEAGMPLAWDITKELKDWLTPEKLRSFNEYWRTNGGGYPNEVIDNFLNIFVRTEQHYESILGYLETQYRRASESQQDYHGLYSWLVDMTYHLLYLRHINNVSGIEKRLSFFEGIAKLANQHKPLWVFSLNHDMIVECLAAKYQVPINGGFTKEQIALPRRNKKGMRIGVLNAEIIASEKFEKSGHSFWQPGTLGINILKIHGGLDIFTYKDGKDLVRLLPLDSSVAGIIGSLKAANEELIYVHPEHPNKPLSVTNEIIYADDDGEAQFLRRTLLAGAFKFDTRRSQVLPPRYLVLFRSNINYVTTLVCIGYSFCDIHINQIIRDWLEFDNERTIEIVDPFRTDIPGILLHLAPQVTLVKSTATEYLDHASGIIRGKRELLEKRLAAWVQSKGSNAEREYEEYLGQYLEKRIEDFAKKVATLPIRDGDIDTEAVGKNPEALVRQWFGEPGSIVENALEEFLESRKILLFGHKLSVERLRPNLRHQ